MDRNLYVVSFPGSLSQSQVDLIRDQIRKAVKEPDAKVIVIGDGARLDIIHVREAGED